MRGAAADRIGPRDLRRLRRASRSAFLREMFPDLKHHAAFPQLLFRPSEQEMPGRNQVDRSVACAADDAEHEVVDTPGQDPPAGIQDDNGGDGGKKRGEKNAP